MIGQNVLRPSIRSMRLRRVAFAAFTIGITVFSAAKGQESPGDSIDSEQVKSILRLADQTSQQEKDRSPLRFEMPRIPLEPVGDGALGQAQPNRNLDANPGPQNPTDSLRAFTSSAPGVLLMAGLTFLPAALLMTTSYVRIQITLGLLRQALGSPSIPGNQVIVALSLLLSVLVMKPVAERVYEDAVVPYSNGRISQIEALRIGSEPIRRFMLAQIRHTGHEGYLEELAAFSKSQDEAPNDQKGPAAESPGLAGGNGEDEGYPLHVVAPAFLLSELTTALSIGFAVYLPFLVVDLVVATVLAAMGIWMMPPTLIATPTKLILFVLADGWMLTAGALINGFASS